MFGIALENAQGEQSSYPIILMGSIRHVQEKEQKAPIIKKID
jgi:hypothetical protein